MSQTPDPDVVFPPDRFVTVRSVEVFDEHESAGHGGKPRRVTADKLRRLAETCNRKFAEKGAATPLSLGHTKDGDVKEEDQPDIVGWATNFRVVPFRRTGKQVLVCDWHVKKQYASVIDEYPHRSIELWDSRDDISPIALLKTTPERDLPIIRYRPEPTAETPYRYVFTPPSERMPQTEDEKKAVAEATAAETGTSRSVEAKIDRLAAQVERIAQQQAEQQKMFAEILSMAHEGGDDEEEEEKGGESDDDADLLGPDDGGDDFDDEPDPKGKGGKKEPDPKGKDEEPEKYGSQPGATNTFIPTDGEKTKMSRDNENDDVIKFQRYVDDAVAKATAKYKSRVDQLERENKETTAHFNRMKAEKAVAELETVHRIDFGGEEGKEEETAFLVSLLAEDATGESFNHYASRIAKKYKRKPDEKPDGEGVAAVSRFARTQAEVPELTQDQMYKFVEEATAKGLKWDDFMASQKNANVRTK